MINTYQIQPSLYSNKFFKLITWIILFLIITLYNFEYIHQPPIWDTAGGLFAPAEYLYRTNFDLSTLLTEKGFTQGGPNVHVYSLGTLLTASDMWFFEGDRTQIYVSLHIFQFAITALILHTVFYLLLPLLGIINTVLVTIAIFLFPPFLVQTRYIYIELFGSLFIILAFSNWVNGYYNRACYAAILACSVKSFGLSIILPLIILMSLDNSYSKKNRIKLVSLMLLSAIVFELLRWSQGTNMETKLAYEYSVYFFNSFIPRLLYTPDLFLFLILSIIGGLLFTYKNRINWHSSFFTSTKAVNQQDKAQRIIIGGTLIIGAFVGFLITVPLTGVFIYPITRYYMWIWPIIPIVLFSIILIFDRKTQPHTHQDKTSTSNYIRVLLLALILFFISNNSGKHYPRYQDGISSFAAIERSSEYESFHEMQLQILHLAAKINNVPIYLNLFDHYFTSSELMGYIDKKKDNFKNIITSHEKPGLISYYPNKFFLVYSNKGHGGGFMKKLVRDATLLSEYQVEVVNDININGFQGLIYKITRTQK